MSQPTTIFETRDPKRRAEIWGNPEHPLAERQAFPAQSEAPAVGSRDWPEPVSAVGLCQNPPPTPPVLIDGMLYQGGTMLLSGASKARKTWAMLDLGISVAGGHAWFGFQATAAPVLYLNLELQDFALAKRLASIARAKGVPVPPTLFVQNLRGRLVTIEDLESRIENQLERTGAKLVIIDPHYKLSSASGVEENSNDHQAFILYQIENAVCSRGAAVCLAHHFSKGDQSTKKAIDRASGGGALARWPDVVATMTELNGPSDSIVAEFALRNFAPVQPIGLRWADGVWVQDGSLNTSDIKKAGAPEKCPAAQLLSVLRDGMENKEWREASSWTDSTYRRKRDELIAAKEVSCRSGLYYHATAV